MIISVKWLQDYVDIDMPVSELARLIGARLVEIEETADYGAKFKGALVAKVVECNSLEGSDHLNVTKLDDGGKAQDVERDEHGYVQVVCGAPNVRAGMFVVWLPPKTIVPETYGTPEPFTLDARKLRGVMSNGMIASPRELAMFDDHEGILEIGLEADPGTSFAELLHLNDTLLDIENKSLTHRPDAFGVIGFAREVAGIQGKQFITPDWLKNTTPDFGELQNDAVQTPNVTIDNPELSARYQGVVIANVDGAVSSPLTLQTYLARVGMRPISAVVDTTNFLMLETGQPLHAFDYDKLAAVNGGTIDIHVRGGKEGETLKLLDGRTIELSPDDIVIANGETAVALAGAMGGAETEIDSSTKTIFLESATFNLYNLRATQMRHGIFSEAITRFTKGQPAALTAPVLAHALQLLGGFTDAQRASEVAEAYPGKAVPQTIVVSVDQVNQVLGTSMSGETMATTLKNVEFNVDFNNDNLHVTAPYWRSDIHIPEDIIEEIGRLNGYDSIEPTMPARDFTAVSPSGFDDLRVRVGTILARAGANEVLTYSFVHGNLLAKAGQKAENSYRITNSISPDLQYYRQSLTPSLLSHVHANIKQGFNDFALFECNKIHPKTSGLTDENVPVETDHLAFVLAHKKLQKGAPFYEAKHTLQYLANSLGLALRFEPMAGEADSTTAPFEPRRSATIYDTKTNQKLGVIGEYKKSVAKAFKLPEQAAGFELEMQTLLRMVQAASSSYMPLSRFPGTERDICFQVASDVAYGHVVDSASRVLNDESLETAIEPVDIYQAEHAATKNITIRIKLTSHAKTLTSDEVGAVVTKVTEAVVDELGAEVI